MKHDYDSNVDRAGFLRWDFPGILHRQSDRTHQAATGKVGGHTVDIIHVHCAADIYVEKRADGSPESDSACTHREYFPVQRWRIRHLVCCACRLLCNIVAVSYRNRLLLSHRSGTGALSRYNWFSYKFVDNTRPDTLHALHLSAAARCKRRHDIGCDTIFTHILLFIHGYSKLGRIQSFYAAHSLGRCCAPVPYASCEGAAGILPRVTYAHTLPLLFARMDKILRRKNDFTSD